MASMPRSVLDQNRETLAAPGKTAAMPMMAMSDGRGPRGTRIRGADLGQTALQELGAAGAELVVELGDGRRLGAQSGDLAEHVEAVGRLVFVARPRPAGSPPPGCDRSPWWRPGAGRRSSPPGPRGFPPLERRSATSRFLSSSKRATNGVRLTRTWWPGPDSSSTVSSQRRTSSWNRGTIAPVVTASSREQISGSDQDAQP